MSTLPSKNEIRKMFPGYTVSIENRDLTVSVGQLQLRTVPGLVITRIASKTETITTRRYSKLPVEMDPDDAKRILKAAGFNAFLGNCGLAVISADVQLGKF